MSSRRRTRLANLQEQLVRDEHQAQLRLVGSQDHLSRLREKPGVLPFTLDAARREVDAAREALGLVHERQNLVISTKDRHTANLPDGSMLLVMDRSGEQYVIERDDNDGSPEYGTWYRLGEHDLPMTFDEAIGVDEGYQGHEFWRLYTAEQVDDLLDAAGVPDLHPEL